MNTSKIKIPYFSILSATIILIALLMPSSSMPSVEMQIPLDKIAHIVLFAMLGLAMGFDFVPQPKITSLKTIIVLFIIACLFAALTEILQMSTEDRHADLYDWCADLAGILLGAISYFVFIKLRASK